MDIQSFKGNLEALKLTTKTTKGHKYSPIEQVMAYYVARTSLNKDKYDISIMRSNRIQGVNLTTSSFSMMVSNMNFVICGRGSSRVSEQGMNIGKWLNKLYLNKQMDNFKLKELINLYYNEEVI